MSEQEVVVIERLRVVTGKLGLSDREFAASMVSQFDKKKRLSEKQWLWVGRLAERAINPPKRETVDLGSFKRVYDMFSEAKKHLKHPKIRFQLDGFDVAIHLAGGFSKYNGNVLVTDGQPYGMNKWYGHINKDGVWEHPLRPVPEEVVKIVTELSKDPEGMASEYGKLSGKCCFCNRELTTENSTEVGYGPICARHFNLPWGGKK